MPETKDVTGAVSMMEEAGADWITFTSSSTVENFNARFGIVQSLEQHGMKPISIGPETSKTLRDLSVEPEIEASTHTISGVVAALREVAEC